MLQISQETLELREEGGHALLAAARLDGIARRADAFLGQAPRLVDDRNERLQCQPGPQIEILGTCDGTGDRRLVGKLEGNLDSVRDPNSTE